MHNIYKYKIGGLTRMDLSSSSIDFSSISPQKLNIEGLAIKNKGTKWFKQPEVQQGFSLLGQASGGISSLLQDKQGYSGEYGSLQQAGDQAFDQASDTVMAINPVVGGIMKAGGLVSDLLTTYGGMGTDSMTKKDAILGSKLLSLTPLGMINGFFGDTTDTISKDNEAFEIVGAAYGGTNSAVDNAVNKSGKKYGFFSRDEMTEANAEIAKAKVQQNRMADIASEAMNRLTLKEAMASINGLGTQYNMQGGYNQYTTRIGKHGMSLDLITKAKNIVKESRVLQKGGQIEDPFKKYLSTLPKSQQDSTNFRVKDYWEYNGKPKDFEEAKRKGMFKLEEDFDENGNSLGMSWHAFTVAKNPNLDEYEFMKSPQHPTIQQELDWYNSNDPEAISFRREYQLQKVQPYYKYVKRRAPYKDMPQHKNGGSIIDLTIVPTEILLINPNEIPEFQEGGQINKKSRTLEELIQYAKTVNPRFIQRMSEPFKYVEWDDNKGHHTGTHELGYTEMDGKYFVFPHIQENSDGNLIRYTPENWKQAVDNAYKNNNGLFLNTEDEAKIFTESQENSDGTFSGYKSGWPEFFKQKPTKYQNGGSINVIPEGALHARKHNMDMDGITKKGIPVVADKGNGEVEQQAEIEREEIIFRLEVTKKLEELEKIYYNEDSSQNEKDEAALEAGKLLVNEIIYNTIDNTNNLL